jgi:hypothetical protein
MVMPTRIASQVSTAYGYEMQALKWAVWHARHGIFCFVTHIDSPSWLVIHVPCQHVYGTSHGCQTSTEFPFLVHYYASHTLFFSFLQGIEQDLKRACEAVFSMASEPLCVPLRAFTGRPASAAEAAVLDETFRTTCASNLRSSLARVRLYVSEARTAAVLVQNTVDRVEDAYGAFRLAARQVGRAWRERMGLWMMRH